MTYEEFLEELTSHIDYGFKARDERILNASLPVYGVRTPDVRALARRVKKEMPNYVEEFFAREEYSHEEVLICGMQLGNDYAENVRLLHRLIPRFASWAETDQIVYAYKWVKDKPAFFEEFAYLLGGGEFEVRAFVMMLFSLSVDEACLPEIRKYLPRVPLGAYYVDMAVAWLLCEVVVKYYEEGVGLLGEKYLTSFVVNKAISKCHDSFRLTSEQKTFLKSLKK